MWLNHLTSFVYAAEFEKFACRIYTGLPFRKATIFCYLRHSLTFPLMPVKAASSTGSVAPNTLSPDVHASSPPTGLEKGEKYVICPQLPGVRLTKQRTQVFKYRLHVFRFEHHSHVI